jgi:hypothetical protein
LLELAAGLLSEKFVLLSSFAFIQMNVAIAFIFLIQEVVTPIIILSCFLSKTLLQAGSAGFFCRADLRYCVCAS